MVTTSILCDLGENKDPEHGLISGGTLQEHWQIHPDDPLSANVTFSLEQTGGRQDAMWKTSITTRMYSDETSFHFEAELVSWLNETLFFEKSIQDTVPRDLV